MYPLLKSNLYTCVAVSLIWTQNWGGTSQVTSNTTTTRKHNHQHPVAICSAWCLVSYQSCRVVSYSALRSNMRIQHSYVITEPLLCAALLFRHCRNHLLSTTPVFKRSCVCASCHCCYCCCRYYCMLFICVVVDDAVCLCCSCSLKSLFFYLLYHLLASLVQALLLCQSPCR
jgi:hypothetical protein